MILIYVYQTIIIIGQTISTTLLEGKIGDEVTFTCTAPRPNEAENNALMKYSPEYANILLISFVRFETDSPEAEGRLTRIDSGSVTNYTFGPLKSSDSGSILACGFLGLLSANATVNVLCKYNRAY